MIFTVITTLVLGTYLLKKLFSINFQSKLPLPPGPKGYPLLGNLTDLPPPGKPEYLHWSKHKDIYGSISSVTVFGQTLVIINAKDVALELMDKQARVYSGRARMKFAEMCGWGNITAMTQFGPENRLHRKCIHQQIGSATVLASYHPILERETGRFLWRVLQDTDNLNKHIKKETAATILDLTYGYTVEPHQEDPLVALVDQALAEFSEAAVPGKWSVDVMPWLERLPEWLPGVGFKRTARLWKASTDAMANVPYDFVKQQVHRGSNKWSYVSKMLEQYDFQPSPEEEHAIKWTAATLYGAGADTSVSVINSFFLAMSIYPQVQRKAQEEIDHIVGSERLPNFDDHERLPYVEALINETLRWLPVAPLGIPHAADEDGHFGAYRLPKGSILVPNVWTFTHDPTTYHEPETFKPERYLEPYNETAPGDVVWGFGRRICAGRAFADASIYLTCVQSLAVFDVREAVDDAGNEIMPEVKLLGGAIGHPAPFKCRIIPRSQRHQELIDEVMTRFPWEESHAKYIFSNTASR